MKVDSYQIRRLFGVGLLISAVYFAGVGLLLCDQANGDPLSGMDFPTIGAGDAPESPAPPMPTERDGSESEREAETPVAVTADVERLENRHFLPRADRLCDGHLRGLFRPPKLSVHS